MNEEKLAPFLQGIIEMTREAERIRILAIIENWHEWVDVLDLEGSIAKLKSLIESGE